METCNSYFSKCLWYVELFKKNQLELLIESIVCASAEFVVVVFLDVIVSTW